MALQQRFDRHINPMPWKVGDKRGEAFFDVQAPGADKPTPPICDHSKPASATIR